MIIFEVTKNGKTVSHSGGKFVKMIHTSVSYLQKQNRIRLVSAGLNEPDKKHQEFIRWFEELPLKPGDEIRIKVMEGENPDTPEVEKYYGDVIKEDGPAEYYCSFCGIKADGDIKVLISQNANICHGCLSRHNPDNDNV